MCSEDLFIHRLLIWAIREIFIFPAQLTTSRIGNHTRLIHTLAKCVTIHGESNFYVNIYMFLHYYSLLIF